MIKLYNNDCLAILQALPTASVDLVVMDPPYDLKINHNGGKLYKNKGLEVSQQEVTTAGIDNGTQSTKVLIYDSNTMKTVAIASAPHDIISREDGSREQLASWWIDALKNCFDQIDSGIKEKIEAIGVSGQQHGFVPVAEDGSVLAPVKLWCDTSTVEECKEITEALGGRERVIEIAGNEIKTGYTAPKILYFKKHSPELYEKMKWVMLPHDYLNFFLTGNPVRPLSVYSFKN